MTLRRGEARRRKREAESAPPSLVIVDLPPERRLDVQAAFATLSIEQQAAAALCLASDMSHAEAALALGIPLGTLKSRVAQARRIPVQALEEYRR